MKRVCLLFSFFAAWVIFAQTVNQGFFIEKTVSNLPPGRLLETAYSKEWTVLLTADAEGLGTLYASRNGKPFVRILSDAEGKTVGRLSLPFQWSPEVIYNDRRKISLGDGKLWFATVAPKENRNAGDADAKAIYELDVTTLKLSKIVETGEPIEVLSRSAPLTIQPIKLSAPGGHGKSTYFLMRFSIKNVITNGLFRRNPDGRLTEVTRIEGAAANGLPVNNNADGPYCDAQLCWLITANGTQKWVHRHDLISGKLAAVFDSQSFRGESIDGRNIEVYFSPENSALYLWYWMAGGQKRFVRFSPDGGNQLLAEGTPRVIYNEKIGVGYELAFLNQSDKMYGIKEGNFVFNANNYLFETALLPNGKKEAFPLDFAGIVGCSAYAFGVITPSPWSITRMVRISRPCVTKLPTEEITAGNKVVLEGENFLLGDSLVDILAGAGAPIKPDTVEANKIVFTVPVSLSGKVEFRVRLTSHLGVMISDPLTIFIKQSLEFPTLTARFAPAVVNAGEETQLYWESNLPGRVERLTCNPPLGGTRIFSSFYSTGGNIGVKPEQSMVCTLNIRFPNGGTNALEGIGVTVNPPRIMAVTNAADSKAGLAPGTLATVWGVSFSANEHTAQTSDPLPNKLGGLSIILPDEISLPLTYVGPSQVNFQIPTEAAPGDLWLKVRANNGESDWFKVEIVEASPAAFLFQGGGPDFEGLAILTSADWSLVSRAKPARMGEVYTLWLTGCGAVDPLPPTGYSSSQSAPAVTPIRLTLEKNNVEVLYAGAAPGFAGLCQLNFRMPRIAGSPLLIEGVLAAASSTTRFVTVVQ